jgi:hypothetical protein
MQPPALALNFTPAPPPPAGLFSLRLNSLFADDVIADIMAKADSGTRKISGELSIEMAG